MRPLFPYYGSKWREARRYLSPMHDRVIEPFAGSAGYSVYWEPKSVHLIDADPVVVGVWRYLIATPEREILALPDLEAGQSTDDLRLPQEARWLIGFWLNRGSATPKKTMTSYSSRTDRSQLIWSERARRRIARDVAGIRHWTVEEGNFDIASDEEATWFVDPPYVDKGRYYRCWDVDYRQLSDWCRRRRGRAIVCEQAGADWLPFRPFADIKSTRGRSAETVWLSEADAA